MRSMTPARQWLRQELPRAGNNEAEIGDLGKPPLAEFLFGTILFFFFWGDSGAEKAVLGLELSDIYLLSAYYVPDTVLESWNLGSILDPPVIAMGVSFTPSVNGANRVTFFTGIFS